MTIFDNIYDDDEFDGDRYEYDVSMSREFDYDNDYLTPDQGYDQERPQS